MELIKALGLDGKILLAQFINFAVLFFVLYKFAYKPMLGFLDDRSKKIEKGITDAEAAKEKLVQIEKKEKDTIANAKKEALAIIEEAKKVGDEKREAIIKKAKNEIGVVINAEKEKMRLEKAETLKEIKREVGELVVSAVEKVLEEKIDSDKDKKLVEKIVKNLK